MQEEGLKACITVFIHAVTFLDGPQAVTLRTGVHYSALPLAVPSQTPARFALEPDPIPLSTIAPGYMYYYARAGRSDANAVTPQRNQ